MSGSQLIVHASQTLNTCCQSMRTHSSSQTCMDERIRKSDVCAHTVPKTVHTHIYIESSVCVQTVLCILGDKGMDEAMQFAKVTGSKVEYFELRCGEAQAQIPIDDSMYLDVDDESYVCLNFQNRELCAFIAKSTELRGYKGRDRLSDFRGMCELRELRNSWTGNVSSFDTPAKKHSRQKQTAGKWPTTIDVGLKLDD